MVAAERAWLAAMIKSSLEPVPIFAAVLQGGDWDARRDRSPAFWSKHPRTVRVLSTPIPCVVAVRDAYVLPRVHIIQGVPQCKVRSTCAPRLNFTAISFVSAHCILNLDSLQALYKVQ